jgi:arylformamidase
VSTPDPLNAAVTVPDLDVVLRSWRAWSDAVRSEPHETLHYGPSADETLDLFVPQRGAPLVIFFHGGYWRRLHKDDLTFVARGLTPHGVAVAIVNYSLAPAVPIETIVAQAQRSVAWLRGNAGTFGADATRLVVAGHSAGGHLAAMCAVDAPVAAVVTLSGLHDLRAVARSFANEWLMLDDARAAAVSPTLLAPAAPCIVDASAGERESAAFHAQGRDFADAWRAHGCEAGYADSPGDDHFSLCGRLHDPDDALVVRIAALAGGQNVLGV